MENKPPIFLNYVAAGYPLLWIQTHEEYRAMTTFAKEISQEEYHLYSWDRVDGVKVREFNKGILISSKLNVEGLDDPFIALEWAQTPESKQGMPDNSILFLQDFHHYVKKDMITRKIRNMLPYFKATGKVLAIISHSIELPDDIEKEVVPIQFKLPDVDELRITLKGICAAAKRSTNKDPYPKNDLPVLEAALGMTSFEAENAFALTLREKQDFDLGVINREKAAIIKKTELLEVVEVKETLDDVGGLDNVKNWLKARENNFSKEAREFGIRPPKGLLLGGLPGTGKSLAAKCTAAVLKRPLLRLDMGRVFGSYVGESEKNIRKCLDIADAVAPCVLWIDELEKSFSGTKGGVDSKGGGNEVSMRVYSTFLTWLQEKTSDVFVVGTANNVAAIDEPLLRRLNCIFWVDLPDAKQREEIIAIHLRKAGRDPKNFALKKLAEVSDKFSGSEIETWIIDETLPYSFNKGNELCDQDLIEVSKEVVPQAIMMAEDIARYRKWAQDHRVKPASSQMKEVEIPVKTTDRKMSLGEGPIASAGMAS